MLLGWAAFGPKRSVRLLNFANPLISQLIMEKTDMTWLIHSFSGIGPIKFGMTPEEVATHIGAPDRSRRGLRSNTFSNIAVPKRQSCVIAEIAFARSKPSTTLG